MQTPTPRRRARRGKLTRLAEGYGIRIGSDAVCSGHHAPLDFVEAWAYDRPSLSLVLGPRGGGKSFLSAFNTHLDSIRYDRHETKILGGSEAQSKQIFAALAKFQDPLGDYEPITNLTATKADYVTGSTVGYIAASPKSVRGPHVPTLRLDEVDEMDGDIRESSFGMSMALAGVSAAITMTSTWHRIGGPMSELMARGDSGEFPVYRFCIWEVLERCDDARSGKKLENCPACPLISWCHADRDSRPDRLPKAKRSSGHYSIDALIQKVRGISKRVFDSDYLCLGPRSAGVWFGQFDLDRNVTATAEYDPALPVHLSVDSGVRVGAVFFQVNGQRVNVFADFFIEHFEDGAHAENDARAILAIADSQCGLAKSTGRLRVSTDSAGGARNPVGPTVIAEYERAGLRGARGIEHWPKYAGSVLDQLALLEAFVQSADGKTNLIIHPRCTRTIEAFRSYGRQKIKGQWTENPAEPQHPHEEMIDALRGGLKVEFPESRKVPPKYHRRKASQVF